MIVELELLDDMVFTRLVNYVQDNLLDPILDDENFTMLDKADSDTSLFPCIYLNNIVATETAYDLEREAINGGLFTYQVRVISNESRNENKKIMTAVAKAMKSMGFRATSLPLSYSNNNLYVSYSRWQREIDEGDEI